MPGSKPRILIIATGGTIAGLGDAASQITGYRAASLDVGTLLAAVPDIHDLADISTDQLYAIDSAHVTGAHWQTLARRVNAAMDDASVDGIVILHGTDTLEETAWFLHLTMQGDKQLVLTGAMRPATALSADGPMNLFHAVAVAANPIMRGLGAVVVFGDAVLGARGLMKRDSTPAAFDADQCGRLGIIQSRSLTLLQRPTGRQGGFSVPDRLPNVPLLYAYADLDPVLIRRCSEGADGLVIASVGNGTLRPDWLEALSKAQKAGTMVVIASRVPNTVVQQTGGFISALHHTPPQARVQLQLALSATRDPEEIQRIYAIY